MQTRGPMCTVTKKKDRLMEIFFRAMKGEHLSIKNLAQEYGVSTKSVSRDINEIKNFLSDSRDLVGNTELKYSAADKTYYLELDNFLLSKELIALIKTMIGCRAFSRTELLELITKLKSFTTTHDRNTLDKIISKEIYHYNEVRHDCKSVIDYIWQLTHCIDEQIEITIEYYKMSRERIRRKLHPVSLMFSDYYFYLIAYSCENEQIHPCEQVQAKYYQVDRIIRIIEHRSHFQLDAERSFDEGELRNRIQYMFPGKYRKIRFEFWGPSVQAILDRIPTARIVDEVNGKKIIEAEVYGSGINMYLLSQGSKLRVLEPAEFVEEMKSEVEAMRQLYQ